MTSNEHRPERVPPLSPKPLNEEGQILAALRADKHRRVFFIKTSRGSWSPFLGTDGSIVSLSAEVFDLFKGRALFDHDWAHPLDGEGCVVFAPNWGRIKELKYG